MRRPDEGKPAGGRVSGTHDNTDTAIVIHQAAARKAAAKKRFETLRARLCLRGHTLHQLTDGSYIVCKWNLTRDLRDLDAVERFAVQVGA